MPETTGSAAGEYTMNIQGSIIEQLGLKQYDTVSAVVAELIANAWDADAEKVKVELPLNKFLATRSDGELDDKGYEIIVRDDGHGMDPDDANNKFLDVGRDRREDEGTDVTPKKGRKVMGRKGIGKLAPFGMCYTIEVLSSGGKETEDGYQISHFKMEYDDIDSTPSTEEYKPESCDRDGEYREHTGTEIKLTNFDYKKVPDKEEFANMLSYRFADGLGDFQITIKDNNEKYGEFKLSETEQPMQDETVIDTSSFPIEASNEEYTVEGKMGLATQSYNNETQGVRIYVRDKLATITRDFKISSGFSMENTIRSYLVGEIHCDFLDEEMDCIRSNRQEILWDTKYGRILQEWGQDMVKEVANRARGPERKKTRDDFFDKTNFEEKVEERFDDEDLVESAKDLGGKLGGTLDSDELDNQEFLDRFVEIILQVAPHDLVLSTFEQIREEAEAGTLDIEELSGLINKTSVAETHSLAQVAREKVEVIESLQKMVRDGVEDESEFQSLVESATWLINPEWKAISKENSIGRFRKDFEEWYENQYEEEIATSTTSKDSKIPDFIMVKRDHSLIVIEIKPPGHTFNGSDLSRFENYDEAFDQFEEENGEMLERRFPEGIKFILITDSLGLSRRNENSLNNILRRRGHGEQPKSWGEILESSRDRYDEFLNASGQT
jgi:hypothetical protein